MTQAQAAMLAKMEYIERNYSSAYGSIELKFTGEIYIIFSYRCFELARLDFYFAHNNYMQSHIIHLRAMFATLFSIVDKVRLPNRPK